MSIESNEKTDEIKRIFGTRIGIVVFLFLLAFPAEAHAFRLSAIWEMFFGGGERDAAAQETTESGGTPKPFPFLSAVQNIDPRAPRGGAELQFVDDTALMAVVGPLGNIAEADESIQAYRITSYTVREGDTLSRIAKMFEISEATIRWANDIPRSGYLRQGQTLVILPVSGVRHVVKRGDTIASIAKKYGGDADEILDFNSLVRGEALLEGSIVVVPDGEVLQPKEVSPPRVVRGGGPAIIGYFARPIRGGVRTQGLHGFNGIDLADSCGVPVYAAASGSIVTARSSGWNGGYGKYVAIAHPNGTQTLYAHLASVISGVGWNVTQGQMIGTLGVTGKATGCHLHFEVRGAKNPF